MGTISRRTAHPQLNKLLSAAVAAQPLKVQLRPDRRLVGPRHSLEHRILNEFADTPATILTIAQATRLFQIPSSTCARVLARLVEEGKLRVTTDGRFRR
jgi:Fic family protein